MTPVLCCRGADALPGPARYSVAPQSAGPVARLQTSSASRAFAAGRVRSTARHLRRLSRPSDLPPLPKIRSLAYFLPVIEELQQQPLPDGYLDYLRLKLRKLSAPARPDVQKNTFSDDR